MFSHRELWRLVAAPASPKQEDHDGNQTIQAQRQPGEA
jgi:hypothetical protein